MKVVINQYITPTLNTNLARMCWKLAERRPMGVYHLAEANRVSRYDFAVELAKRHRARREQDPKVKDERDDLGGQKAPRFFTDLNTSKASRCLNAKS